MAYFRLRKLSNVSHQLKQIAETKIAAEQLHVSFCQLYGRLPQLASFAVSISGSKSNCLVSHHLLSHLTVKWAEILITPAAMASSDHSAMPSKDMLQNRSCGCINSPTLQFTISRLAGYVYMVIHPHFIDRNRLTPSLWVMLQMSF